MANVAPIISTFYFDAQLPARVRLDGVVTVVDAKHIERHLNVETPVNAPSEAVEQIAYADRIVMNKTDLIEVSIVHSILDDCSSELHRQTNCQIWRRVFEISTRWQPCLRRPMEMYLWTMSWALVDLMPHASTNK